ncbi:MAG: hypothetical protein HKN85_02925 [Gammaproteobacteria bacterium]|nr:hypothetical protein [Gammaproteobacteria bacterium]
MATKQAKKTTVKKTTVNKPVTSRSTVNRKASGAESAVADKMEDVKADAASLIDMVKANYEKAQDSGKQSWLVGLGVFGRSADELKTVYTQITEDRQKMLDELAARGEKVQDDATDLLQEGRVSLEQKIDEIRTRLTEFPAVIDVPARLKEISGRLESLAKSLEKAA